MLTQGKSNLIHAPGYPFLLGLPLRISLAATGRRWMIDAHEIEVQYAVTAFQHVFSVLVLILMSRTCRGVFGPFAAHGTVLLYGLHPITLGQLSCFYPEWLQADALVLMLCCAYKAVNVQPWCRQAFWFLVMFFVFSWSYLTKYNSLFLAPVLAAVMLLWRVDWKRKLLVIVLGCVLAVSNVALFVKGFHEPSTGTKALSRDHAWVLLTTLGDWVPDGRLHPEAGLSTKRLIYLNSVLPWYPNRVGPFWHEDIMENTEEYRRPWREKYYYVLSADDETLDGLLQTVPPPSDPYDFFTAFFPTFLNLGAEEGDRLGTAAFLEHVRTYPAAFISHALRRSWRAVVDWPTYSFFPLRVSPDEYVPSGRAGFYLRRQGENSSSLMTWYARPYVWAPGTHFFRLLSRLYAASHGWVVLLVCVSGVFSVSALIRRRGSEVDWVSLVLLMQIVAFILSSNMILFRWKEAQVLVPLLAVLMTSGGVRLSRTVWARARGRFGLRGED